jgi:4-amino-4-deoxy-L-arabinose transferase-like glycosyltransferase
MIYRNSLWGELSSAKALPRPVAMGWTTKSSASTDATISLQLRVLVIAFVIAWTFVVTAVRSSFPVHDDMLEAWSWGQHWQLGYYKHPPFYAWVTAAWFQVLPRADWAFYLLANVNVAIGLLGVHALARRLLDSEAKAATAVLVLIFLPPYTIASTNFNANTVLLSLWPWTAYAFIRSIESRSLSYSWLFGVLAAMSLLSKYASILMLAACAGAALAHPQSRRYFSSPAPYSAIAVCMIGTLPHLWWTVSHGYPTINYALSKAANSWSYNVTKSLGATTEVLAIVLIGACILFIGFNNHRLHQRAHAVSRAPTPPLWLLILGLGPAVLMLLPGLLGVIKAAAAFMIPTYFMLPVLALRLLHDDVAPVRPQRLVALVAAGLLASVVAAPGLALLTAKLDLVKPSDSSPAIVRAAERVWRDSFGVPLGVVSGTERYSLALSFYSSNAASEFSHFNWTEAPWITPERISREGLLSVCETLDRRCQTQANLYATNQTIYRTTDIAVRQAEMPTRSVELIFIMTPPSTGPDQAE